MFLIVEFYNEFIGIMVDLYLFLLFLFIIYLLILKFKKNKKGRKEK